ISQTILVEYFRIFYNREDYITVFNDNNFIKGFLTLKDASEYFSKGTLHLSKVRPIKHQSNFYSYQIALSVLPVYVNKFRDYLLNLGEQTIGIDANISDYNYIRSYIPEINFYRCEDYPGIEFDLVIILRCPLLLQHYLFREAKRINISDLFESFLLIDFLQFANDNNLQTLFIEGPVLDKLQKTEKFKYIQSNISLEQILKDKEYLSQFCLGDRNQIDYIIHSTYGVLTGNRVITNGISLRSGYFSSPKLNVNHFGERRSLPSTKAASNPDIYIYGSCLTFGLFAEDNKTFPSYLQKLINESTKVSGVVHNLGVKGKALLINDLLLAMQSEVKSQDILVFVSPISAYSLKILKEKNIEYFDFSAYLNKTNNPDCIYLNNTYHSNVTVYKELARFCFELISNFPTFSKQIESPLRISGFSYNRRIELFDQHYMWKYIFLKKYLSFLDSLSRPSTEVIAGSLLITANPFTLGHAALIQMALKYCDYLYIFVVENDSFQYSYIERMEMVKRYCENNPKCCVVPSGDIWGSEDLFPEYFNRNYLHKDIIISPEDAIIFGKYIAPKLKITRRFIGDERHDSTTSQYNQYLKKYLPNFGIEVIQFERKKNIFGDEIKGGDVRKIISDKGIDDEMLVNYLPYTTIEVIKSFKSLMSH
ncbi:MAG: hypothetical protein K2K58_02315, partial [Muribaculaceae bacterium]|nr:hypothetical protein [Muribaculaceae bacterium]